MREVKDGDVKGLALLFQVKLAQVKIDLAHRASDGDDIGTCIFCCLQNLARQCQHDFRVRDSMERTATLGLELPLNGLGANRFHQFVHLHRVVRVIKDHDLWRSDKQAAIVTSDLQAFQRLRHPFLQVVKPKIVANCFKQVSDAKLPAVQPRRLNDLFHLFPQRFVVLQSVKGSFETVEASSATCDNLV